MVIKLGPELDYFGDSGAKFKVQPSPDIECRITLRPGESRFREYGYARKPSE
jgi:hypothetical protein